MLENENDLLIQLSMGKAINEYRKAHPARCEGLSDAMVWEIIKNEPLTINHFVNINVNIAKIFASLLERIEVLEKKNGIFNEKSSDRESEEPSSTDETVHR